MWIMFGFLENFDRLHTTLALRIRLLHHYCRNFAGELFNLSTQIIALYLFLAGICVLAWGDLECRSDYEKIDGAHLYGIIRFAI